MSWSNCGCDSSGRPIGYAFSATCDHDGCNQKIDRGLSFACGDMHGATEYGCELYFCGDHRDNFVDDGDRGVRVCDSCARSLVESGEWYFDEDEGALMRVSDWRNCDYDNVITVK